MSMNSEKQTKLEPEKQPKLGPVELCNALHDEYLKTVAGKVTDPTRLGGYFHQQEADFVGRVNKADSDTKGHVYKSFLSSLELMHRGDLTHADIRNDEKLPIFSEQEKKMLDFTDKHFDQIAKLGGSQGDSKTIDSNDDHALENYPHAKLEDPNYKSNFADKAAWAGAAVGTVAEIGSLVVAPQIGAVAGGVLAPGVSGFLFLNGKTNILESLAAGGATAVAWGPFLGGMGAYKAGEKLAEPYWNMTEGRRINKLYGQMNSSIPTYSQFKIASND